MGLRVPVADPAEDHQRAPDQVPRDVQLPAVAGAQRLVAEHQGPPLLARLPLPLLQFLEKLPRLVEEGGGLVELPADDPERAERLEHHGLAEPVARLPYGVQRTVAAEAPVLQVVAVLQEGDTGDRQVPGVSGLALPGGPVDQGDDGGALALEPLHRILQQALRQPRRQRPRAGRPVDDRVVAPVHPAVRLRGEREPRARGAAQGRAPLLLRVLGDRPFPGEQPRQVLEAVAHPAGREGERHQHLRVDELLDQVLRVDRVDVEERGPGPGGEVGHVQRAEQPEHPRGGGRQVPIAQPQARPHPPFVRTEFVEPAVLVLQPLHQGADRPVGFGGEPGGRDAQCQRQPVAQGGEAVRGHRVGGEPVVRGDLGEQRDRLLVSQGAQPQGDEGVVAGQGPAHGVAAGDQHAGGAGAGQQGLDLPERAGVVEHDQDAAAVQDAAEQRGPLVRVPGDVGSGHAERAQEPVEHRTGPPGGLLVVSPHVGEELAVGEAADGPVRPADGERRLAHASDAGDRADRQRRSAHLLQQAVQDGQFGRATRERQRVEGQMGRNRHRGDRQHRLDGQAEERGVGEDLVVQSAKRGPGVDAQLVGQDLAALAIGLQRLGPAPRTVLGQHQVRRGLLPQRVLAHEGGQFAQHLAVLGQLQPQPHVLLVRVEPRPGQPGRLGLDPLGRYPLQGRAAPHGEGLVEVGAGLLGPAAAGGLPAPCRPFLELHRVDAVFAGDHHVAGVAGDQHVVRPGRRLERLAQGRDADGDLVARGRRRGPVPDGVGQLVHRDHPVRREQQHGHDRALTGAGEDDRPPSGADVQRPQDPEHHLKHELPPDIADGLRMTRSLRFCTG
ncbi:hypothetical protein SGRI78S_06745 [Streptomyces griseus subsp. griseus]